MNVTWIQRVYTRPDEALAHDCHSATSHYDNCPARCCSATPLNPPSSCLLPPGPVGGWELIQDQERDPNTLKLDQARKAPGCYPAIPQSDKCLHALEVPIKWIRHPAVFFTHCLVGGREVTQYQECDLKTVSFHQARAPSLSSELLAPSCPRSSPISGARQYAHVARSTASVSLKVLVCGKRGRGRASVPGKVFGYLSRAPLAAPNMLNKPPRALHG